MLDPAYAMSKFIVQCKKDSLLNEPSEEQKQAFIAKFGSWNEGIEWAWKHSYPHLEKK